MVGFENRFDTILKQIVGTVWIARSITHVRIVNIGRDRDLAPGQEIYNVVAHHYNPDVVIVTTFPQSWHYQTAHITADGGITEKKTCQPIFSGTITESTTMALMHGIPNGFTLESMVRI